MWTKRKGAKIVPYHNKRKKENDMEILRVEHLYKTYGKGENQVCALDDVSFTVEKGEFVAVVGQSGSGKSTLLHLLGGVDTPASGHIYLDGKDIYQKSRKELAIFRRRQVGLIYQFYNLIPILTVEENMALPMRLDGQPVNSVYFQELLKMLKLEDRKNYYPHQLSGGQQQRAAIGRALLYTPALILADEPTGNLDSQNSQEIVELFKFSNRKYKQTFIIITHDEQIALQADRMIRIEDGKIVKEQRLNRQEEV